MKRLTTQQRLFIDEHLVDNGDGRMRFSIEAEGIFDIEANVIIFQWEGRCVDRNGFSITNCNDLRTHV